LLLLDQFPRNLYRGRARAFAGDERARAVANTAIDNGFDQLHAVVERYFFYLPLMHSEDLADQDRAIALFESLPPHEGRERAVKSAYDHREAIVRFGRFPHRNRALGRETTEDEAAYLAEQAERNDAHWTQAQGSHHAEAVAQDSDEQAEKAGGS
jgi:uncharacterized protein (DUF924 family)